MAQSQSTNTLASQHATTRAPITMRRLMLLGTFGTAAEPEALLRLPDGRVQKARTGDTVGRLRVIAIEETRIILAQGQKAQQLTIPGN